MAFLEAKLLFGLTRRAELFHVCGFDRGYNRLSQVKKKSPGKLGRESENPFKL